MKHRISWLKIFAFAALAWLFAGSAAWAQTPVPLTDCQVITKSGSYYLKSNLSAPSGDCLDIEVPNIVIDFRGHTITGSPNGRGIWDGGDDANYAIITNGKIRNFGYGIDMALSGSVTINNMQVTDSADAGIYIFGGSNTLNQVKSNNNGSSSGFYNAGIVIENCCSLLTGVQTNNNFLDGMDLYGGGYSVDQATAEKNGGNGIFAGGGHNFVSNSTASGNTGDGIEVDDDTGNLVTHSNASHNGKYGVSIDCPGNLTSVTAKDNTSGNIHNSDSGTCTQF